MHYDDIIQPIWEKVLEYRNTRFRHLDDEQTAIEASTYWALCDSFEQLQLEERISPEAAEHGGEDYINHRKERQGHEIGSAINSNKDVFVEQEMGERWFKSIRKTVVVLKLGSLIKQRTN